MFYAIAGPEGIWTVEMTVYISCSFIFFLDSSEHTQASCYKRRNQSYTFEALKLWIRDCFPA